MDKYIIGSVVIAIVVIAAAYNFTDQKVRGNVAVDVASAVSVVEPPYDFGDIDIFGGKVITTFTLKNEGAEEVTITSAETSCMCTEGEIAGFTFGMHGSEVRSVVIPVGDTEEVKATFDPLAHGPDGVGKITRELSLKTNSSETPEVRLKFSANVIKN